RDRLRTLAADSGDPRAAAFADLAGGRVRAAQGDERATADLQSAMRRFAQLDFRLETARAQLALAGAIAGSSPDAAAGEARSALRAFETAGARADADAAGALLRRLGAAGGRAWPKGAGTLTRRETEVLELLGEGCSNAQIAERLVISRRTAEHHVASVLSKLGLRSRAEAAAHVARRGPADP
ncbi:MAG TPA: helix-turn-helix transcriptional regulator, partial [Solirubrobacteraceae bacterium]|nr:helix-turn-helix transcriptional regulator [Solirubrobacteraceae bacterium]